MFYSGRADPDITNNSALEQSSQASNSRSNAELKGEMNARHKQKDFIGGRRCYAGFLSLSLRCNFVSFDPSVSSLSETGAQRHRHEVFTCSIRTPTRGLQVCEGFALRIRGEAIVGILFDTRRESYCCWFTKCTGSARFSKNTAQMA
jgi:hypothetical protein